MRAPVVVKHGDEGIDGRRVELREIGTMTLAAIVCAGLVVRAGSVPGHLI